MNRLAYGLLAICAAAAGFPPASAQDVPAQSTELIRHEYSAGSAEAGFWWARRRDETTVQFTNWTRVSSSGRPDGVAGSSVGKLLDRPFFIGNAIANLRGLDPTFGTRALTLKDGRSQPAQPQPAAPQSIPRLMPQTMEEHADTPPPEPSGLPDDVWLLKQDGTIIPALRKTPVAEAQRYCAEGLCEQGYIFVFPASAATEAVAVAFRMDGIVSTRKLDSLAGLQQ